MIATKLHWFLGSLLVAIVTMAFYSDPEGIHGELTYDDKGTISWNPVIKDDAPWSDIWKV